MLKKPYILAGLLGFLMFFSFIFFSYIVHENLFTQIDFDTTVRMQDNISRRFDDLFSWFSHIGSFEVTTLFLLVMLGIFRKWIAGFLSFFLFGMFHIIELFGKTYVDHAPPPEFLLRTKRLVEFPQFHVRTESSYPSGHSGRTIFISTLLIMYIWFKTPFPLYVKLGLIAGILGFDAIMLVSRVYLGEHWLSDVIGGSLLAFAFALLASSVYLYSKNKPAHSRKKHSGIDAS